VLYLNKMNEKMKNEMDKAFEDFSKACDKAIGDCQLFIDMDINKKPTRPNYDEMWNVSGYYNDDEGNDIRDRD